MLSRFSENKDLVCLSLCVQWAVDILGCLRKAEYINRINMLTCKYFDTLMH